MCYKLPSFTIAYSSVDSQPMKMKILDKISLKMFVYAGVLEMFITLVIGYGLYEITGHGFSTGGHGLIPLISDCGVQCPEKYVFRIGFVVGGLLMAVQCVTISYLDKGPTRKLSLVVGLIQGCGIAIVGVVSEGENFKVHGCKFLVTVQLD